MEVPFILPIPGPFWDTLKLMIRVSYKYFLSHPPVGPS